VRILVDTHNITNKNANSFNPGNYIFDLVSSTNNSTGGFGRYKNVIGFRLIKAIMPNAAYIINDTNNKVVYIVGAETITITLKQGYYTIDNLANAFNESDVTYVGSPTASVAGANKIKTSGISYNSTTHKFTINTSGSAAFKFVWNTSDKTKNAARILGFIIDGPSTTNSLTSRISDIVPDMSIHYTDLVVEEIPYIACKNNPDGHHIIDRIPLNVEYGSNILYEPYRDPYQNYFLPISLNKLTIKLLEPINSHYYNPQDSDHSLEFEITMIKNEKNVGLFK